MWKNLTSVIARGSLFASIVHMVELSTVALIVLKEEDEKQQYTRKVLTFINKFFFLRNHKPSYRNSFGKFENLYVV